VNWSKCRRGRARGANLTEEIRRLTQQVEVLTARAEVPGGCETRAVAALEGLKETKVGIDLRVTANAA
jgi:hypothetical protein